MAVKELSTRVAIVGRGDKCKGGKSAVEQSSYISRTTLYSNYYGETYYPKYSEDLVHTEIMLPENAPEQYKDRNTLWNSLEEAERKSPKAQIARNYKVSLPNDWSYELATEVMRDYAKRNFVDDGMCCEFAIHDSENPQHERNLHCHILLTMRPILEDGTWGDKQKKVYSYDKDGNKIRKPNGRYKCTTEDVTGWNSRENAKKWRKDLADTINAVNEKIGNTEHFWEYRSFAERGLDKLPSIHLGEKASAMERTGIHSERGDINRNIFKHNAFLEQAKTMYEEAVAKVEKLKTAKPIVIIRNEVLDLIAKVVGKKGRLDLPIMKGEFISKISKRENLQSEQFMTAFVTKHNISTFEELNSFIKENKEKYSQISKERKNDFAEVERLEELQNLYAEFLPYKKIKAKSKSLKGFEKIRYDKDHKSDFEQYKITREALYSNLKDGAKPTPKVWSTDISKHNTSLETTRTKYSKVVMELAYSEVLEYNRKNLEREQQNDRHQPSQNRKKEHDI